jgi:hypothetical protein
MDAAGHCRPGSLRVSRGCAVVARRRDNRGAKAGRDNRDVGPGLAPQCLSAPDLLGLTQDNRPVVHKAGNRRSPTDGSLVLSLSRRWAS